jgi:urease accessory protein
MADHPAEQDGNDTPTASASSRWLIWQLVDASYPTGGFAHSGGLEAAVRSGRVRDAATLRLFLRISLRQWAMSVLPFASAAHAEPEAFTRLDDWLDATLTNHVTNRASRRQGMALLSSSAAVFGGSRLKALQQQVARTGPGHFAPVIGVVAVELGIPLAELARMCLFMQLRDGISAAVRLDVVGSREGQQLQRQLSDHAEQCAQNYADTPVASAAQPTPWLELIQANHDRLSVRLFQS